MIRTPRQRICFLIFGAVFILQYGVEHALYLLTDAVYSGTVYMTASGLAMVGRIGAYVVELIETVSMGLAALLTLIAFASVGKRRAALTLGVYGAAKLFYIFPHYYMTLISGGYDSIESLLLVIPISLALMILLFAEISVADVLALLPARRKAKESDAQAGELLLTDIRERELLDVANNATAAIAIISATLSVKLLVSTTVDTVKFFITYNHNYTAGDIFSILFDYLFIIATATLSYFTMHAFKAKLLTGGEESEDGEDADEIADTDNTVKNGENAEKEN